jgi:hypothetical protein
MFKMFPRGKNSSIGCLSRKSSSREYKKCIWMMNFSMYNKVSNTEYTFVASDQDMSLLDNLYSSLELGHSHREGCC